LQLRQQLVLLCVELDLVLLCFDLVLLCVERARLCFDRLCLCFALWIFSLCFELSCRWLRYLPSSCGSLEAHLRTWKQAFTCESDPSKGIRCPILTCSHTRSPSPT
jgi:hypothetical protein